MNRPELFSPTLADLIGTVRDHLKDGQCGGYEAQVARYLLDMSLRELEQGPALERRSMKRMSDLLGGEAQGPDPMAHLCRSIRAGGFDERLPELLAVLIEESAERVAIVRPDVLARARTG